MHPGGEHAPAGGGRDWNSGHHRRIFLRSPGTYVRGDGTSGTDSLVFWGEWEADAELIETYSRPLPHGPRHLFAPFYRPRSSYLGLQNTDPFVFGDTFHYAGCQQYRKGHPTQLQRLPRGSVVLFGSRVDTTRFALDTVLVVASSMEHSYATLDQVRDRVSRTYDEVTLRPWYAYLEQGLGGDPRLACRLYWGATPADPVGGMFSFFPALPEADAEDGFPRPTISLNGLITDHLSQGFKGNALGADLMAAAWRATRDQVLAQGLLLGVHAELPPRRAPVRTETLRSAAAACTPTSRPARELVTTRTRTC